MGEHGLDDLLRVALLAQDRRAVLRVLVERRMDLVVEVVEERGDAPQLLVAAELARVRGRRRLDRERVPEQRFALRVPRERLPGLFASRRHGAASIARYGRHTRTRRRLRDRGSAAAERHDPRRREQERRAADPRRVPPHRRAGDARERAAHPRRRHDARAARRPRRRRGVDRRRTRCASTRGRVTKSAPDARALQQDPRVVPARRPAARALRPRDDAAAGRRRDRTPPPRPAHPRVRRARRRRSTSAARYDIHGRRRCAARTSSSTRRASWRPRTRSWPRCSREGETVLGNAACEPHVQDLCRFLVSLGAQIEGIESNVLRIHGVEQPRAAATGRSAPTTSRSAASSAWRRSPAAT